MYRLPAAVAVVPFLLFGCQRPAPEAAEGESEMAAEATMPAEGTPEWSIQNAMSAGPSVVTANATVMAWGDSAGAPMTQLRAGTNGWTCMPDLPLTPVNDPMCLDSVWVRLVDAWSRQAPFETDEAGVGYMLQGGADASNDDPSMMAPPAGGEWNTEPPHTMLVPADPAALAGLPTAAGNGAWVMWSGSPYAHLMVPVE